MPVFSVTSIFPAAASRQVATTLTISGVNIAGPIPAPHVHLVNCQSATAYDLDAVTVASDGRSFTTSLAVLAPASLREQGLYTVIVTNGDGQTDELDCALRIVDELPPTVTDVIPATAWQGLPNDNVNSDTNVTIKGTGFTSTPSVRWVKTDGSVSYEAQFVGFVSSTQLTAVAPSETLGMALGDYHVFVTNPDLLSGEWLVGGTTEGIFEVTATPPPVIDDISPARIAVGACASPFTVSGGGFAAGATLWYEVPPGVTCTGSIVDANGNTLCPIVVDTVAPTGDAITAHFGVCPGQAAYPIIVINPDGQADTFYSVEITPSSDGHLNTGKFTVATSKLETPRWKHATQFGFGVFADTFMYVAGGQNAASTVLGSVEASAFDIFGKPGPFHHLEQYGGPTTPRVANNLATPRVGSTLVRVGFGLYSIGGATTRTDVTTPQAASNVVERAQILSYAEMPAVSLPQPQGGTGLPTGTWYYRVSAVGPWGEGLATGEVVALNVGGAIKVCWNAPSASGATGYNIYRSRAADGRAGSASAIAYEVPGPCFLDDGAGTLAPAPGNVRGVVAAGGALTAGTYTYRVAATVPISGGTYETYAGYESSTVITATDVTAGNKTVSLAWDPVPGTGVTYRVFRLDTAANPPVYKPLVGAGALATAAFVDGGVAFDTTAGPRAELPPLAPGALSKWTAAPALHFPREGLDGVAIAMDPATSGDLVARILVAGGRDGTSGTYAYRTTAESIGVHADGTLDAAWSDEAPVFAHARAYYALLTTQDRNSTPYPPPPATPPCGDLDGDGYLGCQCAPPGAQVDCDDSNPDIHPGATEICGDGIDQDCDLGCGGTDLACACSTDVDVDTHLAISCGGDDCCDTGTEAPTCTGPNNTDCTATSCTAAHAGAIHPGVVDACGDGIDADCDGIDPACACATDADGDGHTSIACGGDDCCDTGSDTSWGCTAATAGQINPSMPELCGNSIDDDCDGYEAICAAPPPAATVADVTRAASSAPPPRALANVAGTEPVYIVAVAGLDANPSKTSGGRSDFEGCQVDMTTGHLLANCGVTSATTWIVQNQTDSQATYAADAVLYFSFLYPFRGAGGETLNAAGTALLALDFIPSSISRFGLPASLAAITAGQVLINKQAASVSFAVDRGYYQMNRLLSQVYVIGGWAASHLENGVTVPEGPTGLVEVHQQ